MSIEFLSTDFEKVSYLAGLCRQKLLARKFQAPIMRF